MTDMQTSLPLLIVRPSILNPVINFSTHLWPMKWNALGNTFALRIPFHLLHCWCNTCTNMINNDMIHSISSHDHIGSSILTSLALHRCFGPSTPSHHLTCPSHLQPVYQAKSCLDLLHLSRMTQCHVSYAMSSLKALVWFWWIDETLSANLVYQSDYEIGSTFQVVKQMVKIMMMVWTWWSSAETWKRRKRKIESSR